MRKTGEPRWETPVPRRATGTYGTAAIRWARETIGITPGPWQARSIRAILRHDRDGSLMHRMALLGTGRQNGKSVIVRIILGWMLAEGHRLPAFAPWTTMLTAAHDAKQARIPYRGVYGDFDRVKELKARTRLTQYFGIEADGLLLDTVTSQPGSARGASAGLIAWDEVVTQRDWDMWEALSPTQSAQVNPLMILTSTAGQADSVVLRSFYDRLVRQASRQERPDPAFYGAWWQSDDPDAGLDWRQLKQANPALGDGRLTRAAIRMERELLPPDSWRRERLNHWVDTVADAAFRPEVWRRLRQADPLEGVTAYHLGIDVHPGWERASVYVAGVRPDGRIGVEPWRDLRAEAGPLTAATIIEAVRSFPRPRRTVSWEAVIGPAAELGRAGDDDWGVEWRALRPNQVVAACIDMMQLVQAGRIAVADPLLDAQVPMVAMRPIGQDGAYRWSRAMSRGPIDAVFAATFAIAAAVNEEALPNIK